MLIRMVKMELMCPMLKHLYRNGFNRPIRMFEYEENNVVKGNTSNVVTKNVTTGIENPEQSKKYAYRNNYKGKKSYDSNSMEEVSKILKGYCCKS